MKCFIFRKNYLGFYDWAHAMNKIRRLIHGYDIIGDPAFAKDIHIENIDPVFRGAMWRRVFGSDSSSRGLVTIKT